MLPLIPPDKALHFIYGAAAACAGCVIAHLAGLPPLYAAPLAAAAVGVGKEVYDRVTRKGTPDALDAVATALGAVPVVVGLLAAAAA